MLVGFYIPSLSNDMKLVVQKSFKGQIFYRRPDPVKKRRHIKIFFYRLDRIILKRFQIHLIQSSLQRI